ncbi:MAG TPA: glutamine--tRNA ligase/YqeY domain fusion protein [Caldilineae bacterium]|nr:glutamine--tRNA ligase/YqeY domain fusion protein [Caldilineae bacterium]
MNNTTPTPEKKDFIREIVAEDNRTGRYGGRVVTRFPPEPNGFLHIGHAKSISLNFGVAEENGGVCHLRFDDTNPETEDMSYVESIQRDIRWLGFDWGEHLYFASDYFEQFYAFAVRLIEAGRAYVDSLSEEEIRVYRGTVTEPGRNSPYRERSVEENLELFRRMRAGEFPDGAHVLRAKIDMASPNMKMRDPLLYRIRHASHYRRGDEWCIYPMYDFAHPLEDAIENVTHSLCTLEFENNRAVYDWLLDSLFDEPRPHQYEFARLALDYTVMSKRKLLQLVNEGYVSGWDDPRMFTISGLRRRGVTPEAIRTFVERVGVAKVNSRVETVLLEHTIRDDLNYRARRVMAVLDPLKVVISNYPAGAEEWLDADYWPRDIPREGTRKVPFGRTIYIEREDFAEEPPRGFKRLSPGQEVRLRHSYVIKCEEVIRDELGRVLELRCTYDPTTLGARPRGRKVKGAIHWVSAEHALPAEVRLYDRLFARANPDDTSEGKTFKDYLNPNSLITLDRAFVEPSIAADPTDTRYQFERQGYFIQDAVDSRPEALVFNRIIGLRDTWTKRAEPAPQAGASRPVDPAGMVVEGTRSEARDRARAENPPLQAAYERYRTEFGLEEQDADLLSGDLTTAAFFDAALAAHNNPKSLANWINNVLQGEIKDATIASLPFGGAEFGKLVALVDAKTISHNQGKQVLAEMLANGGDPETIVAAKGMKQISDADALAPIIDQIMADNAGKVSAYRNGKIGLLGFFMGQVMRQTGGKANPQLVKTLLEEKLSA